MKACVCARDLSALVNGSRSDQINIQRGLKQGDPLAPFCLSWWLKLLVGYLGRQWKEGDSRDSVLQIQIL